LTHDPPDAFVSWSQIVPIIFTVSPNFFVKLTMPVKDRRDGIPTGPTGAKPLEMC
jgi:hypothetical protein